MVGLHPAQGGPICEQTQLLFLKKAMLSKYDKFAAVYNRHWGEDSLGSFPQLERLVLRKLDPGSMILDACCGTGQFARKLTDEGFRVVGIDASFEMLRHAAVNAPGSRFACADVRRFCLFRQFDAAFSLYDSLNHLLTLDDLESAFLNVASCLAPGGAFAFDLNTEVKYRTTWSGTMTIEDPGATTSVTVSYDQDTRLAEFRAAISSPDRVRPDTVHLLQTWYPVPTVFRALERSGLSDVSCISLDPGVGIEEASRVLFVGRKSIFGKASGDS